MKVDGLSKRIHLRVAVGTIMEDLQAKIDDEKRQDAFVIIFSI